MQIGDVESGGAGPGATMVPFDLMISETGFSLKEATQAAQIGARLAGATPHSVDSLGKIGDIMALFQMGPVTGNAVFTDDYADGLLTSLRRVCPSGAVSGLFVTRESRKYPIVSGEIVRVRGFCLTQPMPQPTGPRS